MSPIEKFVILSHGRTGSTTLCHGMSMHPDVEAYGEVFHKKPGGAVVNGKEFLDGDDGGEFCRNVVWQSPNEFEKRVIGFKIFFFHARKSDLQYNAWRYLTSDPSIKVILLLRPNIFDSYVSAQRSRASGVWRVERDGTVPEKHQKPIPIDVKRCYRYMASTVADTEWGRRAFAAHPFMEVLFDNLQRDFQGELNRIFEFLGVEPQPVPLTFEKLNTTPHPEGIANYDEVLSYFRYSVFREFFLPE